MVVHWREPPHAHRDHYRTCNYTGERPPCQASQLREGERLPACSEVIETCFGKFKTLERDQAKGGFTGLLLSLAGCAAECSPEVVHEALQTVKTREVIAWIKTKLGPTVGSKRHQAYPSAKRSNTARDESKSDTKPEGTPLLTTI
jgi:hypothetical protein